MSSVRAFTVPNGKTYTAVDPVSGAFLGNFQAGQKVSPNCDIYDGSSLINRGVIPPRGFATSGAARGGFATSGAAGGGFATPRIAGGGFATSGAAGGGFATSGAAGGGFATPRVTGGGFTTSGVAGGGFATPRVDGGGFATSGVAGGGFATPRITGNGSGSNGLQVNDRDLDIRPWMSMLTSLAMSRKENKCTDDIARETFGNSRKTSDGHTPPQFLQFWEQYHTSLVQRNGGNRVHDFEILPEVRVTVGAVIALVRSIRTMYCA
jgi:hypothetical protein